MDPIARQADLQFAPAGRAFRGRLWTALLALCLAGCGSAGGQPATQPVTQRPFEVALSPVQTARVSAHINVTGSVRPDESAVISAKVSGRVTSVRHDRGDVVQPGELLATIDPTEYALEVARRELAVNESLARIGMTRMPDPERFDPSEVPTVRRAAAQAANASERYDRYKALHAEQVVSDQDFADARTAWEVAKSELDVARLNAVVALAEALTRQADLALARQRLEETQVLAPAAPPPPGTRPARDEPAASQPRARRFEVAEKLVAPGTYVGEGTPLVRLIDNHPLRFQALVPERHAGRIALGQKAAVKLQTVEQRLAGRVVRISPEIDPNNRAFFVEIAIDNPDRKIKSGGFATAAIEVRDDRQALFVPAAAVTSFAGISRVFFVEAGKAKDIRVKCGPAREDGRLEILEGLTGTEEVISPVPGRLVTGSPVVVRGRAQKP